MTSAASSQEGSQRYFPALDGLRLSCCAAVVLAHCFLDPAIGKYAGQPLHSFVSNAGRTGVDVFFALSGFLITKLLLDERDAFGRVDLKAFYVRRTLRIFPVYYVALVIGFGGAGLVGERWCRVFGVTCSPELFTGALPAFFFFLGNWYQGPVPSPVGQLWSVGIEEQFYLLFPVMFVFSRRKHPVFLVVLIGLLVAWITRVVMASIGGPIMHNTLAHADNLLGGALLAQTLQARPAQVQSFFRRLSWVGNLLAVLGLLLFNQWNILEVSGPLEWLAFYVVSAVVTTFMVGTLAAGVGPLVALLRRPILRAGGRLTYSAYVFHFYAVVVVWHLLSGLDVSPWWLGAIRTALALPLALGLAYLSRVLFEKRILDLKERFQPLANLTSAGVSSLVVKAPVGVQPSLADDGIGRRAN